MDDQQLQTSARATFLSLLLTVFFGGGFLLFLILVSGGFFLYVALAVLGVGSVGYLHYLLWGQALEEEVAAERSDAALRDQGAFEQLKSKEEYRIRRR